jgi:Family of unknown function (DUF6350)
MTDVLEGRARVAAAPPSAARREPVGSVWVRGGFAAVSAAALGFASLIVLSLLVWAADSRTGASAGGAIRLAAQLWLVAHRTPLRTAGGALTIPPLGLTLVLGLFVARATAFVARGSRCADPHDFGIIVASVTLPYAVFATVLAASTPSTTFRPSAGAAFVCAVLVGGLFASLGAASGAGITRTAWRTLPFELRTSMHAAAVSAAVLAVAATVLALGSVLSHTGGFATIVNRYHGSSGLFSMLLLSLLLVPNAVVFSFGYLVGPGFAIGAGTSVALGGSHVGAMPALPLLAAVPSGHAPTPVLVGCIVAVVAAGGAGGWRITRRSTRNLVGRVQSALTAAAVLGVGAAAVVGFAGGPAGPGRLSAVGPSPWQVGLAVAGEMAAVSIVVVLLASWVGKVTGEKRSNAETPRP